MHKKELWIYKVFVENRWKNIVFNNSKGEQNFILMCTLMRHTQTLSMASSHLFTTKRGTLRSSQAKQQ